MRCIVRFIERVRTLVKQHDEYRAQFYSERDAFRSEVQRADELLREIRRDVGNT